jgi:DNA-binding MarR family transcriptional regulator
VDETATPAPPAAPARLRTLPSWLLNQTAIAANRLTDRALAETGSRRYHFAVLAALDEFGPSSQADLGRCTGIDRSDVVAAVNALVEQGLLGRSPDPADGRRNVITLTASGTDHLEHLSRLLNGAQEELLHALTPAEAQTLVDLLSRVHDTR